MRSDGQGSVTGSLVWLRGMATYTDGRLILDIGRASRYRLRDSHKLSSCEALFALATISQPADAVTFIDGHGLLWHGPDAAAHQEPFADWEREAGTIAGLLSVYHLLCRATDGGPDAADRLRAVWESEIADRSTAAVGPTSHGVLLASVSAYLAQQVNEGLVGVEERIVPAVSVTAAEMASHPLGRSPSEFRSVGRAPHLLGHLYYQLSRLLDLRKPISACQKCGRLFLVEAARPEYCSRRCELYDNRRPSRRARDDTAAHSG